MGFTLHLSFVCTRICVYILCFFLCQCYVFCMYTCICVYILCFYVSVLCDNLLCIICKSVNSYS